MIMSLERHDCCKYLPFGLISTAGNLLTLQLPFLSSSVLAFSF